MSLGVTQSKDQAGSAIGVFWSPVALTPHNQTRTYSRGAYYDNFVRRANLHALTSRHVTKLLTSSSSGTAAVNGVEVRIHHIHHIHNTPKQ